MKVKFVEVDDKLNWGKFQLQQWEPSDLATKSKVRDDTPLLLAVEGQRASSNDPLKSVFVRDLQTEEGATLHPQRGVDPRPHLEMHRVWVCPLFEPFARWLYDNFPGDVAALPDIVDVTGLTDGVLHLQGYRRPGEEMLPLATIRDKMVAALRDAAKLPDGVVEMAVFQKAAVTPEEWLLFCVWRDSLPKQEYNRWLGSMMTQSGRFVALPIPGQCMYVPREQARAITDRLKI